LRAVTTTSPTPAPVVAAPVAVESPVASVDAAGLEASDAEGAALPSWPQAALAANTPAVAHSHATFLMDTDAPPSFRALIKIE